MSYTPRLTKPEKGNKYYVTKSNGGYSKAIEGKCKSTGKPDPQLNVLANCVGYATGRFHEIAGDKTMSYLCPVNAEIFPEYARGCKQGSTPKLGSVIVWQKGATLGSSDGAGHVAIVEKIISDTQILVSQSGYNSTAFWTETCTKKNGNWILPWMSSAYKFRCFIYNPKVPDDIKPLLQKGDKGPYVKELQEKLNKAMRLTLDTDGIFGAGTDTAVKDFQKKYKLTADGIVGNATWTKLDEVLTKPKGVEDLVFTLNGKQVEAWGMVAGGQNYIRMVDLEDLGIVKSVNYNSVTKKIEVIK